jgi:hypothetical protein
MTNIFRRTIPKISLTLLLILGLISLAVPNAAAFENPATNNKSAEARSTEPTNAKPAPLANNATATVAVVPPTITYIGYNEAMKPSLESPAPFLPSLAVSFKHIAVAGSATKDLPPAPLPPRSIPAVSTAPMTPGEKFHYFAKKSFLSITPYALTVFGAILGEATDKDHGRHMTVGDFLADSGTHAARSFAFRMTSNFFEKFAYASLFRQDPRYHRSDKRGLGGKVIYAVTRVFVTQGDRCGCDQFNISFLAGGLTASGIAQSWKRKEDRGISSTLSAWVSHIGVRAFTNILNEFIGGQ